VVLVVLVLGLGLMLVLGVCFPFLFAWGPGTPLATRGAAASAAASAVLRCVFRLVRWARFLLSCIMSRVIRPGPGLGCLRGGGEEKNGQ